MNKTVLIIILSYVPICLWGQSDTIYIRKIYNNLNQIKSASYYWYQSASILYDTIPALSYNVYQKVFDNPEDNFVGTSIANFQSEDTTRLVYFYDGKVKSYLDWENKVIPVDSFQNNRYPYRIVYPPFHTHIKSLLKYALETQDSAIVQVTDMTDSVLIKLTVYDKLVEVVGNRIVYADIPSILGDKWSKYDFWINKADNLPYRMIKKFPDRVCWETCKDIRINKTDKINFIASENFPAGFTIKFNEKNKTDERSLEGTVAPDWKLKDINDYEIALSDLKSKVLLVQFTGIGCGPCYNSIPFLKTINNEYKKEDLEIISIETWNHNNSVIKKHIASNSIYYKYLICNNEVKLKYKIQSVPRFFILDEHRVIRNITSGFDRERTYVELKETIDKLLKE